MTVEARDEPTALEMAQQLDVALHGSVTARPISPSQVWQQLLDEVKAREARGRAAQEAAMLRTFMAGFAWCESGIDRNGEYNGGSAEQGFDEWSRTSTTTPTVTPSPDAAQEQALDALEFAQGAIYDAIGLEDGLDVEAGRKVIFMIRDALHANGRPLMPLPAEDAECESVVDKLDATAEAQGRAAQEADQ